MTPTTPQALSDERLDIARGHIEVALSLFTAIHERRRVIGEEIEAVRTIADATKLAAEAARRLRLADAAIAAHEEAAAARGPSPALSLEVAIFGSDQARAAALAATPLRMEVQPVAVAWMCDGPKGMPPDVTFHESMRDEWIRTGRVVRSLGVIETAKEGSEAEFDVIVTIGDDSMHVAGASGPRESALAEAMNYARQYVEEGDVEVFEVTRTKVAALSTPPAERCPSCDDTGDVVSIDGHWRGYCSCPAGERLRSTPPAASQPWGTGLLAREELANDGTVGAGPAASQPEEGKS